MIEVFAVICLPMLVISILLALYRLFAGPTILDRIIGFDMVAIGIIGIMILLSLIWQSTLYVEIMLIFSLLGFLGTVAFVSFLYMRPERLGMETKAAKREEHRDDA